MAKPPLLNPRPFFLLVCTIDAGKVIALDGSKPLIDAATKLGKDGVLVVECPSTRASNRSQEVILDADANPQRVTFRQCDPMCLPAGLAGERAVFAVAVVRFLYFLPFRSFVAAFGFRISFTCVRHDSFRLHANTAAACFFFLRYIWSAPMRCSVLACTFNKTPLSSAADL